MSKQRLYLARPMSGLPSHNFPAFHAAATWLSAQLKQEDDA